MKELKKYFFETLIQLTILATLFRQNGRLLNESSNDDLVFGVLNTDENLNIGGGGGGSGFLFAPERGIIDPRPYLRNVDDLRLGDSFQLLNDNLTFLKNDITDQTTQFCLNRHKSSSLVQRELKILIQLVKKNTAMSTTTTPIYPRNNLFYQFYHPRIDQYFVLPASFYSSCNNQKDIINLSETRLLLNSIELNNNQIIKDIEMDIDIQTLIQQDIDLGIKQSLNYNPTFGTTSTGEFDFLKFLNENSSSAKIEPSVDFYLRQQLEIQKNDDILTTTNLLDNESIPEGYKVVLEEDTGECFLILIRNDSMRNPSESVSTEHANFDSEWGNFSQVIAASRANQTQPVETSQDAKSISGESESESADELSSLENHDELNIQVKFSVFLKDEAINLLNKEYHRSESQINTKESEPDASTVEIYRQNIPFLSQTSVNNELDKLDTSQQQVNAMPTTSHNNNNILNSLNESLNGFDNLLDDVWVNNILSSEDVQNQQQQQQQQQQTEIRNVDFLTDDKMLSTLNSNSTILNDTNLIDQLANHNNNLNNNTNLVIDNLDNYLTNDEQTFDLLFGDNVLVENQLDETKPTITQSASNLEEENMAYTFNQFEQILMKSGEFDTTTSTLISNSNQISFNNHHDADNNNNDKANLETLQFQPQLSLDLTLKQEAVDVEDKILVSDLAHEQQHQRLPAALNGLRHNHTYLSTSNSQSDLEQSVELHPYSYKSKMRKMLKNSLANDEANSEQMRKNQSKDVALLKEFKVDLTLEQIVDTSADEFGELMKANNLSHEQINLIKDIRRRAKNKVAAQICRKRKLDSIDSLKEQVDLLKQIKSNLLSEFNSIQSEIKDMTIKFDDLYKNAIGSSYDTNDPIIAFIKNLKDYNSKSNRNVNGARAKTYDSNNSSDLDSDTSNSESPKYGKSSILNDFYNEDDSNDFDDDDEDDDDDDELFDDEDEDDIDDASDNEFIKSKSSTTKKPSKPAVNKFKKLKRN